MYRSLFFLYTKKQQPGTDIRSPISTQSQKLTNIYLGTLLHNNWVACGLSKTYSIFGLHVGVEVGHQEGGHVGFIVTYSIMEGSSTKLICKRSAQACSWLIHIMPSCMGTTSLHSVNSATDHIRLIRVYLEVVDKQLHALPAILLSSHVKCCLLNL